MTHLCTVFPSRARALAYAWTSLREARGDCATAQDPAVLATVQQAWEQQHRQFAVAKQALQTSEVHLPDRLQAYLNQLSRSPGAVVLDFDSENWVQEATFKAVDLEAQVPAWLGSLKDLNLAGCGALPVNFAQQWAGLKGLRLGAFQRLNVTPTCLQRLPSSLEFLHVVFQALDFFSPEVAKGLPNLKFVRLEGDKGCDMGNLLCLPPMLEKLFLTNPDMAKFDAAWAQHFDLLQELTLVACGQVSDPQALYLPRNLLALRIMNGTPADFKIAWGRLHQLKILNCTSGLAGEVLDLSTIPASVESLTFDNRVIASDSVAESKLLELSALGIEAESISKLPPTLEFLELTEIFWEDEFEAITQHFNPGLRVKVAKRNNLWRFEESDRWQVVEGVDQCWQLLPPNPQVS